MGCWIVGYWILGDVGFGDIYVWRMLNFWGDVEFWYFGFLGMLDLEILNFMFSGCWIVGYCTLRCSVFTVLNFGLVAVLV